MSLAGVRIAKYTFGIYKLDKLYKSLKGTEVSINLTDAECALNVSNYADVVLAVAVSKTSSCSVAYSFVARPIPSTESSQLLVWKRT